MDPLAFLYELLDEKKEDDQGKTSTSTFLSLPFLSSTEGGASYIQTTVCLTEVIKLTSELLDREQPGLLEGALEVSEPFYISTILLIPSDLFHLHTISSGT